MKPIESYRLAIALRYWRAAHLIVSNQIRPVEYMEPVGHLLSMSAEVGLKAFLSGRGYSDKKLQKVISHDLEKCMWHAIREGLKVDANDVSCVLTMRPTHLSNLYRYGMPGKNDGGVQTGVVMMFDEQMTLSQMAKLLDRISGSGDALRSWFKSPKPFDWPETEPVLQAVDLEQFNLIKAQVKRRHDNIEAINSKL